MSDTPGGEDQARKKGDLKLDDSEESIDTVEAEDETEEAAG
jgi:hypothetical protein